jgi:hypothetical protein
MGHRVASIRPRRKKPKAIHGTGQLTDISLGISLRIGCTKHSCSSPLVDGVPVDEVNGPGIALGPRSRQAAAIGLGVSPTYHR